MRWLLVAGFIAAAIIALRTAPAGTHAAPSLTALDVGQGDSILVDAGLALLVDTGVPGSHAAEKARETGARVAAVLVTHLERDHAGDIRAVVGGTHPAAVFWNGRTDTPLYEELWTAASSAHVPLVALAPGDVLRIGSATYRVLWPTLPYRTSEDHNDSSLVIRADLPGFSALLTGDLPSEAEAHLPQALANVDVLKVGHHGSKGSSSDVFLDAVSPAVAVISVGKGNTYGHPTSETLNRLRAHGAVIRRTDEEGSVRVTAADLGGR